MLQWDKMSPFIVNGRKRRWGQILAWDKMLQNIGQRMLNTTGQNVSMGQNVLENSH